MAESSPKYLDSINLLRGLAAFLVVWDHIIRSPYEIFNRYFGWLDNLGAYGVAIFFVISGFMLPYTLSSKYTIGGYGRFMAKRFIRIQPVYVVSILIASSLVAILTRIAPNAEPLSLSFRTFFNHFFYLVPFTDEPWILPVYWTLAVEMQFYLLIGLLYPSFRKLGQRSKFNMILISLCLSLLILVSPLFKPLQLFQYIPYFAIGILCAMQYPNRLSLKQLLITLTIITTIVLLSGFKLAEWLVAVGVFFIIMFWHPKSYSKNLIGKTFFFMGTISYSWFVTHQALAGAGESFGRLLLKLDWLPLQLLFVNLVPVVTFLASILLAYALYLFVEIPTHNLARKIKYK